MINKGGRRKLALIARQYLSKSISNFELEAGEPDAEGDSAISQVFAHGFYNLYSDNENHYCVGKHALTQQERKTVARWLLFLYAEQEYEWPVYNGNVLSRIVRVLTFSFPDFFKFGSEAFKKRGDFDVWPFLRRADYKRALLNPPFFSGGKPQSPSSK